MRWGEVNKNVNEDLKKFLNDTHQHKKASHMVKKERAYKNNIFNAVNNWIISTIKPGIENKVAKNAQCLLKTLLVKLIYAIIRDTPPSISINLNFLNFNLVYRTIDEFASLFDHNGSITEAISKKPHDWSPKHI
jgi:hypothetical protein